MTGKIRAVLWIFIIIAAAGCGNKDIFKDPSLAGNGSLPQYKVNGEDIFMPAYFNLPGDRPNILLEFEKPGAKPVPVSLQYTVDGWKAFNGKVISDGTENAGLVLDFTSGAVYEMPQDDLKNVLSKFTADNATVVEAVIPLGEGAGTVKLATVDAQGNYNKQELKYLNLLNGKVARKPGASVIPGTVPVFSGAEIKNDPDRNAVSVGRPVISAAAGGQYDRLSRLLNSGEGNINEIEDATGDNALIKAIRNGAEEVSSMLLNKGIDPKHANKAGQTALHASSDIGFYDISKRLIDMGAEVNARDNGGNTPLMYAAASPNPYVTELLAENGGRLEDKNKNGDTPLSLAAIAGNTETVERLIKKGADTAARDKDGNDVIMKATVGGNEYTVKKLLSLGVPPDNPNAAGVRPLHVASKAGFTGIAGDLLAAGADVNAKDPEGNTPLIIAAERGDIPLTEKILEYKPNVLLTNKKDKNAYSVAADKGYGRIERMIGDTLSKLDTVTTLLFEKVAANDAEGARLAIERGAGVNSVEASTGNTPIFTAIANNYLFMTKKLVELGADVNRRNLKGNTPLIIAAISSDAAMIDALINSGAMVNARNNNGDTALIWATKLKRPDMVRRLLLAGADPNMKNNDSVTAYLIAYNEGPREILALLQAAGGHK